MKFLTFISVVALLTPCAAISAQTVTVNKTATPNGSTIFNTVSSALAVEPDTIQITDSAVYEEVYTINSPVEIVGTATERPILTLLSNPAGGFVRYSDTVVYNSGGIVIKLPDTMTTGAVKLRNLVILPQKGVAPADRLRMAIENQNNNLYLELDNVLITANNGNDEPLSPEGMTSLVASFLPTHGTYNPNHVPFGGNGIVLGRTTIDGVNMYEGDGVELLFKDSIITHFRNDYNSAEPERFPKCILMTNPYPDSTNPDPNIRRLIRVEGESVVSHARVGIECSGDLRMSSDGDRIVMIGHTNQCLDFTGPAVNERTIEDVAFVNSGQLGIWDRGHGPVRFTLRDCVSHFILNSVLHVTGTAAGNILIEESTLLGGRFHATAGKANVFNIGSTTQCSITVRDSILGGKLNHSAQPGAGETDLTAIWNNNVFAYAGTNNLILEGSAMIGAGPYSFRLSSTNEFMGYAPGAGATRTGEATTHADPQFVHDVYSDPLNPNFLDVVNSAYATASSTGGPLSGGGDYVGVSTVSHWSLY